MSTLGPGWWNQLDQPVKRRFEMLTPGEIAIVTRVCNGESYQMVAGTGTDRAGKEVTKTRLNNVFRKFGIVEGGKTKCIQLVSLLMLPNGHEWKQTVMQRNRWPDAPSST